MKYVLIALCTLSFACAHQPQSESDDESRQVASDLNQHKTAYPHTHNHGPNCGHESMEEGNVTYYKHNNEKHFSHAGHVDIK